MTKKEGRFNCKVDKELLDKYMKCVHNASEDIRAYMQKRVNQSTTLEELQMMRVDLINQIEQLKIELDDIDAQIDELKILRQENTLNKKKLMDVVDIVKQVSSNSDVEGITIERIEEIAENHEIKPHTLVNECKRQGIKFISKKESEKNSKIIKEQKDTYYDYSKDKSQTILNIMLRDYNKKAIRYSNNADKFLQDDKVKDRYSAMCSNEGIPFDSVVAKFRKLHPSSKADD